MSMITIIMTLTALCLAGAWQLIFRRDDKATRQRLKALCRAHAANKREQARLATLKAQTTKALRETGA